MEATIVEDSKLGQSVQGIVKVDGSNVAESQTKALTREERMKMQKTTPQGAEIAACDISGSMAGPAKDGRRCIDCDLIPEPMGGTDLTKCLEKALTLKPKALLVVSDGEPNNRDTALEAARMIVAQLKIRINVIYIGPDDTSAKDFMKELAKIGHGRYKEFDIAVNNPLLLGQKVKGMLALPAPKGSINL